MTIKPLLKSSLKHDSKANDPQDGQQGSGVGGSSARPSHRGTVSLQQKSGVDVASPQRELLASSAGSVGSVGLGVTTRRRRSPNKRHQHKRDVASRAPIETTKSCNQSPAAYQLVDPIASASCSARNGSPKPNANTAVSSMSGGQGGGNNSNGNNSSSSQTLQKSTNSPNSGAGPDDEQYSGYNSGDEHIGNKEASLTLADWADRDKTFAKSLNERGFVLNEIAEDGACLFRSISLQIYGDQDMHEVIRNQTMDYIYKNREYFAQFVTEDITSYVLRKRNNHVHGNHIEIQAISEIYNRPVELYCYQTEPINIFNSDQLQNGYEPLRLSYQRGSHYNAILNPYKASVGVGLGLAGYSPSEPDRTQMHEAVRLSEDLEIEQTMFEDKLKTTDWEATNEAIEEQIARESYMQWCRENKHPKQVPSRSGGGGGGGGGVAGGAGGGSGGGSGVPTAVPSSSTVTSSEGGVLGMQAATSIGGSKSPKVSDEDDAASFGSDTEIGKGKNDVNLTGSHYRVDRRRKRRRAGFSTTATCCDNSFSPAGPSTRSTPTETQTTSSCTTMSNVLPLAAECNVSKQSRVSPRTTTTTTTTTKSCAKDLPGTSKSNETRAAALSDDTKPNNVSSFYHELLEASFSDELSDIGQLSEDQMLQKALQMSRMDFVQKRHNRTDSEPPSP